MKRKINWGLLVFVFTFILGIVSVNAATMQCSTAYSGLSTYGRTLDADYHCFAGTDTTTELTGVSIKSIQWYSNTTESIDGGTAISGATSKTYTIPESLVGKYIYYQVTLQKDGYDDFLAKSNVTSKIGRYITESDKKITIDVVDEGSLSYELQLKNADALDNYEQYYLYISKDGTAPTLTESASGATDVQLRSSTSALDGFYIVGNMKVILPDEWYVAKGYDSAYLYKRISKGGAVYYIKYTEPIKLTRPAFPAYGQRYQYYFFDKDADTTVNYANFSVFPAFPSLFADDYGMKTKVGKITDNELLKKLAKNQSGSMNELYEYAKNADGRTYEYENKTSGEKAMWNIPIGDFNIENGAYYYIYTTFTNAPDYFIDLSDVTIAMGESNVLVNDIKWKDENATPTKNPQTGAALSIAVILIGIITSAGIYIITKRKNKFNRI